MYENILLLSLCSISYKGWNQSFFKTVHSLSTESAEESGIPGLDSPRGNFKYPEKTKPGLLFCIALCCSNHFQSDGFILTCMCSLLSSSCLCLGYAIVWSNLGAIHTSHYLAYVFKAWLKCGLCMCLSFRSILIVFYMVRSQMMRTIEKYRNVELGKDYL